MYSLVGFAEMPGRLGKKFLFVGLGIALATLAQNAEAQTWRFERDVHEWRGSAILEPLGGTTIQLGCTRAGAVPANYPGGYVRPHEPGFFNLLISPEAFGLNPSQAAERNFQLQVLVDGADLGRAQAVFIQPELKVATNIPIAHPIIERLKSGNVAEIVETLSGARVPIALRGSSAAIRELETFCQTPLGQAVAIKPSFDCSRAGTPTEKAICSNSELAKRDVEVSAVYGEARAKLDQSMQEALLALQRAWLAERDSCGANVQCLAQSMDMQSQRIRQIAGLPSAAPSQEAVNSSTNNSNASPPPLAPSVRTNPTIGLGPLLRRPDRPTWFTKPDEERWVFQEDAGDNTVAVHLGEERPWKMALSCSRDSGSNGDATVSIAPAVLYSGDGSYPNAFDVGIFGYGNLAMTRGEDGAYLADISANDGLFDFGKSAREFVLRTNDYVYLSQDGLSEAWDILREQCFGIVQEKATDVAAEKNLQTQEEVAVASKPSATAPTSAQDIAVTDNQAATTLYETLAVRATLTLPDPIDENYYGRSGYYSSDYYVPLVDTKELDLNDTAWAKNGKVAGGYADTLSSLIAYVTPLFYSEPGVALSETNMWNVWIEELGCVKSSEYCTVPDANLFPDEFRDAVQSAPRIRTCQYDRLQGEDFKPGPQASSFHQWVKPQLAFWANPISVEIAPDKLSAFQGSSTNVHPLIAIGPYLPECPVTLGEAVEYIAGQSPELFPAAAPAPQVTPSSEVTVADEPPTSSLDDKRQGLSRELLGMTVAEVTVDPRGNPSDRKWTVIDLLDQDSPAYRAGYRSGDYITVMGWSLVSDVASFVRELDRHRDNGAVTLLRSYSDDGQFIDEARLIAFAQEELGDFRQHSRDAAQDQRPGWTLIAKDEYGQSVSVSGEPWCAETVQGEYAQPLEISQTSNYTDYVSGVLGEGLRGIKEQCPEVQTALIDARSTKVNTIIHTARITYKDSGWDITLEGLQGLPVGHSVRDARRIAEDNAPLCDRLAAHPSDPNRRYGLLGSEFIAPDDLEAAIEACISELDRSPDDPLTNFHLGRVLHAAALFEDALLFFEIAAAEGHGGALDYLGQMYANGEGVTADFDLADSYWTQAEEAGFLPFDAPETVSFDPTGVTWPEVATAAYEMSIQLMPQFADQVATYYEPKYLAYLYVMVETIAASCGDPAELNRYAEALNEDGADVERLEHTLFLYESYLPNLLPRAKENIDEMTMLNLAENAGNGAFALTNSYECDSVQIRQFSQNVMELLLK
ncbi:lysozyme inhibitor LprI family protein [Actibacterium ureilyticum]|uniref:lysozyme inhibitor LprI family protein n=1 Tax=Actibacterium ureilyticum TaxID=1590614 RepID=UPI001140D775|nr:lysozyme inhibitor LprI family protein [Actibacterium ureilyticum]